jgi:hypothetical protein
VAAVAALGLVAAVAALGLVAAVAALGLVARDRIILAFWHCELRWQVYLAKTPLTRGVYYLEIEY